jgi:hypothetical protein
MLYRRLVEIELTSDLSSPNSWIGRDVGGEL